MPWRALPSFHNKIFDLIEMVITRYNFECMLLANCSNPDIVFWKRPSFVAQGFFDSSVVGRRNPVTDQHSSRSNKLLYCPNIIDRMSRLECSKIQFA